MVVLQNNHFHNIAEVQIPYMLFYYQDSKIIAVVTHLKAKASYETLSTHFNGLVVKKHTYSTDIVHRSWFDTYTQ
ncbi:hypothetical protein ASV53_00090 [Photobacterium sanguinicancri]|uniref:Uncharacterized protein n=1 Tax=Photobacterium sanguinicancri TaxID=875932 RepID=A0ABX4G4G1_9GAMM|nr:hypothetical protein ASV53_00090 [Photobacterium sanguinicancri]